MELFIVNKGAAVAAPYNEIHIDNSLAGNMETKDGVGGKAEDQARELCLVKKQSTLNKLLEQISPVDFRSIVNLKDDKDKLARKHFVVCSVEQTLKIAEANNWGLRANQGSYYVFNNEYWETVTENELKQFLGKAYRSLGVDKYDADYFKFQDELYKQFLAAGKLPSPEVRNNTTLINLKNGTFEISSQEPQIRSFNAEDFITYQLLFSYNTNATAPLFNKFLNRVLPDEDSQKLLAEYIGYVFIKRETLNIPKVLLLLGSGSNGKSVVFEIISALLGSHNITNYSLEKLTDSQGTSRAALANKLLNYASEISNKLDSAIFKQLASGEPVEARKLYGDPFSLTGYAKFMFNCNQLPFAPEQTHAYFRRFLILPFNVTISEDEADPELAQKIIQTELSGVFNWVLIGVKRLLEQKKFTESALVKASLDEYKKRSDNVALFVEEEEYKPELNDNMPLQSLYGDYVLYCQDCGYRAFSKRNFSDNLRKLGFTVERKSLGMVVFTKDKHASSNLKN
jgi:putative DNA primase/helicase